MNMRSIFPMPGGHGSDTTLVLVGLHRSPDIDTLLPYCRQTLEACAQLIDAARTAAIPVAYVRRIEAPASLQANLQTGPRYPAWLPGFEPKRDDPVFDAPQHSCYSSEEFGPAMSYAGGNFAVAGLFGETACLSTAVDAYHQHHSVTYLKDAARCRRPGVIPPDTFQDAVAQIIAAYGEVADSSAWIRQVQLRRLAH